MSSRENVKSVYEEQTKEKKTYLRMGSQVKGLLRALHEMNSIFCDDEDVVKVCVRHDPMTLFYASARLRDKKDVVMIAVNKDGRSLEFASSRLRNDLKVVKGALSGGGRARAVPYIGSELELDKEVLELVINEVPRIMQRVDRLILDKDWVVKVMKKCNGRAFKYLPETLRRDKDFVLKVIDRDVYTFLDKKLKRDRDVFWAAMERQPEIFYDAPQDMRSDAEVAKRMLKLNANSYSNLSYELRANKEILALALRFCKEQNVCTISEKIPYELRTREVALKCIEINGMELQYYWNFQDDEALVCKAVTNNSDAFEYASERLRNNKEIAMIALTKDSNAPCYLSEKLCDDYLVGHKALTSSGGWVLEYLSERLCSDYELVKLAVKNYGGAIEFASNELKDNEEIALIALKNESGMLSFISDRLKEGVRTGRKALEQEQEKEGNIFKESSGKKSNYDCLAWFVNFEKARKCKEVLEEVSKGAETIVSKKMRL